MLIELQPQRSDAALELSVSGDVLTINGEAFDFASVSEGAILPRDAVACTLMAGDVTRSDGVLVVPIVLPVGPQPTSAQAFPMPIEADGGPVELPQRREPTNGE